MVEKDSLREAIIRALEQRLQTAIDAANTAKETATSKESIAENKYDTFGLEASYLAHGQSQRVLDLQNGIEQYRHLAMVPFGPNDAIDLTCLVTTANDKGEARSFFIGPEGGGLNVPWNGRTVTVITPGTPLGSLMIGKYIDDEIELNLNQQKQIYDIIEIL